MNPRATRTPETQNGYSRKCRTMSLPGSARLEQILTSASPKRTPTKPFSCRECLNAGPDWPTWNRRSNSRRFVSSLPLMPSRRTPDPATIHLVASHGIGTQKNSASTHRALALQETASRRGRKRKKDKKEEGDMQDYRNVACPLL